MALSAALQVVGPIQSGNAALADTYRRALTDERGDRGLEDAREVERDAVGCLRFMQGGATGFESVTGRTELLLERLGHQGLVETAVATHSRKLSVLRATGAVPALVDRPRRRRGRGLKPKVSSTSRRP
jgi:hypothetical protein